MTRHVIREKLFQKPSRRSSQANHRHFIWEKRAINSVKGHSLRAFLEVARKPIKKVIDSWAHPQFGIGGEIASSIKQSHS